MIEATKAMRKEEKELIDLLDNEINQEQVTLLTSFITISN